MGDDFATLRTWLERSRDAGASFDGAWSRAVDAVAFTLAGRQVAEETREAWQRAYDRQPPTPADRAVVAAMIDGESAPATPQNVRGRGGAEITHAARPR